MSDPLMKNASILGSIEGQAAILIIEKTAFGENVSSITTEKESPTLKVLQRNDVCRWYLASLSQESTSIKATIIYPATEVHIRKHQKQKRHMIKETPEIYKGHVEEYIQTMKGSRLQWYCIFARL
jgi:m7GpppX diphosphatase